VGKPHYSNNAYRVIKHQQNRRERERENTRNIIIIMKRSSLSLVANLSSRFVSPRSNSSVGITNANILFRGRSASSAFASTSSSSSGGNVSTEWKHHQPVQSKRPSYAPSDTPHTKKWLESETSKAPMDWIAEVAPIGVNGGKVNCHSPGACKERFGEGAALGAPATYYTLADTSAENPAKCKYCGLRFYSLDSH